jgi:MoxR-like ATPase
MDDDDDDDYKNGDDEQEDEGSGEDASALKRRLDSWTAQHNHLHSSSPHQDKHNPLLLLDNEMSSSSSSLEKKDVVNDDTEDNRTGPMSQTLPLHPSVCDVCGVLLLRRESSTTTDPTSTEVDNESRLSGEMSLHDDDDDDEHGRTQRLKTLRGSVVLVPSAQRNLKALASLVAIEGVASSTEAVGGGGGGGRPILLCGPPGSAKTSTIRALAHATNRLQQPRKSHITTNGGDGGIGAGGGESNIGGENNGGAGGGGGGGGGLLELHVDESVDAKTLLGSYVCGSKPGEFAWQDGPLAVAMVRGDWVLIEDVDRAPRELLTALRPILEGKAISVAPHRPPLTAAPGFKLFGTATTIATSSSSSSATRTSSARGGGGGGRFSPTTTITATAATTKGIKKPPPPPPLLSSLPPTALFGLSRLFLHVPIHPLEASSGEVLAVAAALHPSLPEPVLLPLLRSFDDISTLALVRTSGESSSSGGGVSGSGVSGVSGEKSSSGNPRSSSSSSSRPASSAGSASASSVRVPSVRDLLKVCTRLTTTPMFSAQQNGGGGGRASHVTPQPQASFRVTSSVAAIVVPEVVDVAVVGCADDWFVSESARRLGAIWSLLPETIVQRCTNHRPDFRTELVGAAGGAGDGGGNGAVVVMGRVRLPAIGGAATAALALSTTEAASTDDGYTGSRSQTSSSASASSSSLSSSTSVLFAHTSAALRMMERVAAATAAREPVLLVGETGGGKTTLVQELAKACGHELMVQNLSLQTDAADLLGGYRPVDVRALAR